MRGNCSFCFVDIGGIDDYHCLNFLFIGIPGKQYTEEDRI